MRVAQVVITKTQSGKWKITAMSLNKTEDLHTTPLENIAITCVLDFMRDYEWEQLTLDI